MGLYSQQGVPGGGGGVDDMVQIMQPECWTIYMLLFHSFLNDLLALKLVQDFKNESNVFVRFCKKQWQPFIGTEN